MGLKIKRIARNMGRIEFIACKDQIYSMLQTGHDIKKIFESLRERKMITMAYSTLCYQLAKSRKQNLCITKNQPCCCSQNIQKQIKTDNQSNSFSVNKSPSTNDMI
ncbi:TraK family protein [Fundidesulfovibrio putealis]|uniref:TraK family protein n=1 Tax=Fundidesulfovibrio putealis TaxID=270496 RepID=UPI00146FA612